MKACTDQYETSKQIMAVKRKERTKHRSATMSAQTKDFLQKICSRRTTSIDMTHYGFINDCKLYPINSLLKPLQEQLNKICGNPNNASTRKNSAVKNKVKTCLRTTGPESHQAVNNTRQGATYITRSVKICLQATSPQSPQTVTKPYQVAPCILRSALSSSGARTPYYPVHKVSITTPYSPSSVVKKNVRIILPKNKKK